MTEIWRDIKGYEGIYQVSNFGNVRSLDRYGKGKHGKAFYKGKMFTPNTIKYGYKQVCLRKDGKYRMFLVHRLVAKAFIPNPNNKPHINHIDRNTSNNSVDNLEWVTHKENMNYEPSKIVMSQSQLNEKVKSKRVLQYTLEGDLIKEWPSASEIKRELGFERSCICRCCRGEFEQMYGYKWEYSA